MTPNPTPPAKDLMLQPSSPRREGSANAGRRLLDDRWVWVGGLVWVVSILPSLVSVLPPDLTYAYADQFSDVAMLLLTLGLGIAAGRTAKGARERQFWYLIAAALVSWLAVRALYALISAEAWGWGADLTSDVLYLAGYLALALGMERRPDRVPAPGLRARLQNLEVMGALLFGFGLLAYFVLIPSVFDPEAYASWVPSLMLYAVLDLFLVTRITLALRQAPPGWVRPYGLLLAFAGLWLVGDVLEGLMYLEAVAFVEPGTPADLLWHLPSLMLLLAVRSRAWTVHPPSNSGVDDPERRVRRLTTDGTPLMALALSFPAIHLGLALAPGVSTSTQGPRNALVLLGMASLAALFLQHRRLHRRMTSAVDADRRSLAEQLQSARRIEAVARLAGGVAEDFSDLLSVIRGRADLLLMQPLAAPGRDDAEEIVDAARRGEELVEHLLTLSRRHREDADPMDLSQIALDLMPLLGRLLPDGCILDLDVGTDAPVARVNRAQIEQVLVNLVLNARDALDGGRGRIRITTDVVELADSFLAAHGGGAPGTYARLAVVDDGPGIPPEMRQAVFEPFFTTRAAEGASGLGLSVVYGIAQQAGGFVCVRESEGDGASVEFYVPRSGQRPATPSARASDATARKTILVVEDYDALRRSAVRVLSEVGHRVLEARNGLEALGILERQGEAVDLLLADLVLPDVTGYELSERASARVPSMATLFMSGYAAMIAPLHVSKAPQILEKPFSPSELIAAVRGALERNEASEVDAAEPDEDHREGQRDRAR